MKTASFLEKSPLPIEVQLAYAYQWKLEEAQATIDTLTAENQRLKEQLALAQHRRFGKQTEVGEPLAETSTETITVPSHTRRKKTKGRLMDFSHLPRRRLYYDLPEDQKTCACCQQTLQCLGEDVSEQLEIIPQQLYVEEHIRYKYACRRCETITMAPKPLQPIPKAMAGASLLAEVVVNKYHFHLPLYRQSKLFKSHHAIIPDNTLANWVMQIGDALMPLADYLWQALLACGYLQVDETPIQILNPNKKGYLWVYYAPTLNLIFFEFSLTRSGKVAENRLADYQGALQTDGYAGYDALRLRTDIDAFGCLTHARRKFDEVLKISKNKEGIAAFAMERLKNVYVLEARMKEKQCSFERRQKLRLRLAKPILDDFHDWLLTIQPDVLPKSQLGGAIQYTLKQWPYISKYVHHGQVEIDNNPIENKIRDIAVGKKNWLFMGNQDTGKVHALFYSLILSATAHQLNPRIYLHYLMTQVHDIRQKKIDPQSLLPHLIQPSLLNDFAKIQANKAKQLTNSS